MRVIVTGKGGVGKTTVAAALAAALAEEGLEVIAVDADGSPNLSLALEAGDPEALPAVANLTAPLRDDGCASEDFAGPAILEEFAVPAAPAVRLVQTGRIERPATRCLCCGSHATARKVLAALEGDERTVVVADLEPGANDLLWARPGPGDVVVVVTEASRKSIEVAGRTIAVTEQLGVARVLIVANKLRPDERDALAHAFGNRDVLEIDFEPTLDGVTPQARPDAVRALTRRLAAD